MVAATHCDSDIVTLLESTVQQGAKTCAQRQSITNTCGPTLLQKHSTILQANAHAVAHQHLTGSGYCPIGTNHQHGSPTISFTCTAVMNKKNAPYTCSASVRLLPPPYSQGLTCHHTWWVLLLGWGARVGAYQCPRSNTGQVRRRVAGTESRSSTPSPMKTHDTASVL
jgi:hypothetical protein